jgi:starch synthase
MVRVVFATAELAPFVKVGGLGDAAAGLVVELRRLGVDVEVILPDYGGLELAATTERALEMPAWAGPATIRSGSLDGFADLSLVSADDLERPHPYLDRRGRGWPDNDRRFLVFSAAIAAHLLADPPDLVHLNDWHTGATLGLTADPPPSLLTIHNLAYQGITDDRWLEVLTRRPEAYEWYGDMNPLTGAIALADRVVAVSPHFAEETLRPESGFGVDEALAARGPHYLGILNGIDTSVWDPATDPHLPLHYGPRSAHRKRSIGRGLAIEMGWPPSAEPLIGMVTRLTDQKGVDLALEAGTDLGSIGARMILLGAGDAVLARGATRLAERMPDRFAFVEGYDESLAHRIFAGCDLFLMPSRFEPAGLAQMQAMRYGTIPVVTDVGGLHDTVIDADAVPDHGTGFVAASPTVADLGDALGRAVRAWRSTRRRGAIRRRGMTHDWSWRGAAARYLDLYEEITSAR